jgi:hypothetical protein
MWHYVIGCATIFGLIVKEEAKRARELLERHGKILEKLSEQHAAMIYLVKAF